MSLFTSCKRGNLDGVKAALSRGEMEALSCGEKLKCVNAALQTKRNGALMETLMEHLDLDRLGQLSMVGQPMEFQEWNQRCLFCKVILTLSCPFTAIV